MSIVLVIIPLLWGDTTTMTALIKERIQLGICIVSEACSIIIMMGNMAAGMAAVVLEKELRTTSWSTSRETSSIGPSVDFENLKSHPLWHTYITCHISDFQLWLWRRLTCILKATLWVNHFNISDMARHCECLRLFSSSKAQPVIGSPWHLETSLKS